MTYKVLDTFLVGDNTSVTIGGNGDGLRNDILVTDSEGREYHLLSVAMVSGQQAPGVKEATTILLEGVFSSDAVILKSKL